MCTEELAEYYNVSQQECALVLHFSPGDSDYIRLGAEATLSEHLCRASLMEETTN